MEEIRGFNGDVSSFTGRSTGFRRSELYARHRGRIRFFHVDGDHTAFATYADLVLASEMICANGVIAIDDFGNMRYPQLHAGIYKFLFERPDFKMFLCGAGKAYLCLAEDFAWFDAQVRERLIDHVTARGSAVALHRSPTRTTTAASRSSHAWATARSSVVTRRPTISCSERRRQPAVGTLCM